MFIQTNKFKKLVSLLKLEKPLIIFDVEATGMVIHKDKICELAYIKIWPDGRVKKGDIIGYSGSTGIGTPHLHFEIRNANEQPLNPLAFILKQKIISGHGYKKFL